MRELKSFRSIGWDFDGTLIQHPKSELFWKFIHENPYGQTHHIVTFRSGGMEKNVMADLIYFNSPLGPSHFDKILSIDHQVWYSFNVLQKGVARSPEPYMEWKAQVCRENSIPVLVDDMPDLVSDACRRLGIRYLHPDDLND